MKTFKVVKSCARYTANTGEIFVGNILDRIGFRDTFNSLPIAEAHPQVQISYGDIFTTLIGNQCAGSATFEATREYDNDRAFYEEALGVQRIASPERLRQRIDEAAADDSAGIHEAIRKMNISLLSRGIVHLTPICNGDLPLDCDVTPYDETKSHKEGVFRTYKGTDGFAPMDAHIGKEGFAVNTDFRIGKQHSQKGTPEFLIQTLDMCNEILRRRHEWRRILVRLDSGNDASDNIGLIIERGHHFIIKRNLRRESLQDWLTLAKQYAPIHENPREGKDVYIGSTWKPVTWVGMDGQKKTQFIRIVFEVTERTIDKYGQFLMPSNIEVNTWWDNTGLPDKTVIELYHEHATMEQYHSELKSDMAMEKLPSGKFATNTLIHEFSMLSYNILRVMSDHLCDAPDAPIKTKAFRRRLRTVIMKIIHTPARIISQARQRKIDLGSSNVWADTFIWLYEKLCVSS